MLTRTSRPRTAADPVGIGRSRRTGRRAAPVLAAAVALAAASLTAAPGHAATSVQRAPVNAFEAAGSYGGSDPDDQPLTIGTKFPPRSAGAATLKRGSDRLQLKLQTSGLPPGAYTVWWVIFNTPSGCSTPCDVDDLLNEEAQTTVFWATGGVVGDSGVATFRDRHGVSDHRGEPGTQDVLGSLRDLEPQGAEVHNIIKYHGPASSDPDVLYQQTHTLKGNCGPGVNAIDHGTNPPFGVQCFDPQAVRFPAP